MPLDPALFARVAAEIRQDEGLVKTPYFDTVGKLTVGYGRNIRDRGFTVDEARAILAARGYAHVPDDLLSPPLGPFVVAGALFWQPLADAEAERLLAADIAVAEEAVRRILPRFESFSPARKAALLNLAFNLGGTRLLTFRKMLAAIRAFDWKRAAEEALASKWASQVGPRRSGRIAKQLEVG